MTPCNCVCSHFNGPHDAGARHPKVRTCIHEEEPDSGSEYGRLLAERDRLIADGIDPADLVVPEVPYPTWRDEDGTIYFSVNE